MPRRPKNHSWSFRKLLILRALCYAFVPVFSLTAACGSDETPWDICDSPMISAEGEVQAGQGEPFVPFVDGSEVEIVAGRQGLFHIDVSVQMSGLEPGARAQGTQPWAYFRAVDESFGVLAGGGCAYRQDFSTNTDGYEMDMQIPLVLNIDSKDEALALDGSTVEFSVTLVDHTGRYAEDMHPIVLQFSEPDDETRQASPCSLAETHLF